MKSSFRFGAVIFVILVVTGAVWATGVREEASDGEQILRFALSGNPDTLDPHATSGTLTFQVIRSVYDTLVEPDADGRIVPALAEEWTVSPDGRVWEFTLRRGVRFHNGDPLTSADVKATFERLVSPEMNSGKAGEFAAVESIDTPDSRTVVFTLDRPQAAFIASLASGWGAILPKSLIEAGHDFGREPVGTGPFVVVEWIQDNRIVMERNPEYWMAGAPSIDGVVINIIGDSAVMVQGLMSGDFDAIESVGSQDIPMLEADPGVTLQRGLTALVEVLAMNTQRGVLADTGFRQAVAMAIDKEAVMEIAYGGGPIVGTFMDVGNPYYVDFTAMWPYDPQRARAAVASSPYNGETLVMRVPENYDAHVTAAQMYQEMLEEVGINVELQLVDWSTWLGEVYRGDRDYDFTVIGHTGKLDPSGRLGNTAESAYGSGASYVQWVNPTAANAIGQAAVVSDLVERRRLYTTALEEMAREVPHVYVGSNYRYLATRSNVRGVRQDTLLDTFDFRYVEIGE